MKKPGRKPTPNGKRYNVTVPEELSKELRKVVSQMQKGTYKPNDNNA